MQVRTQYGDKSPCAHKIYRTRTIFAVYAQSLRTYTTSVSCEMKPVIGLSNGTNHSFGLNVLPERQQAKVRRSIILACFHGKMRLFTAVERAEKSLTARLVRRTTIIGIRPWAGNESTLEINSLLNYRQHRAAHVQVVNAQVFRIQYLSSGLSPQ
jgi:hypothetical protein